MSKVENKVKFQIQISNYSLQICKLHMVLFKLEMIQANNKLFCTEKNYKTKSNTNKLPLILYAITKPETLI
jgi:hypothetical protein